MQDEHYARLSEQLKNLKRAIEMHQRDFENGAVRDEIRIALREQEQQKPTVTIEWIHNRIDKEYEECGYSGKQPPKSYEIKGMFFSLLKELGVEVVDD